MGIASKIYAALTAPPCAGYKQSRLSSVVGVLSGEDSPFHGQPYIEGGRYHWTGLEGPIDLDLLYTDRSALAVIVTHEYYADYSPAYGISPKDWRDYMESVNSAVRGCRISRCPLLMITPQTPIDRHSLLLKVEDLLS